MIVVDNISYDLSKFEHPGGNDIIELFSKHDNDLTMAFVSNHSRTFPHNKYKLYRISNYDNKLTNEIINKSQESYSNYLELIQVVKDSKITSKPKFHYWIKLFLLLSSNFYINYYLHFIKWSFKLSLILAYINALIGLNIQHDANHGSLSNSKTINTIFGLTQNLIGGSRKAWITQHMVKHHIYTNILGKDPDTDGKEIIRLNKYSNKYSFQCFQHIYTLIGIPLFSYQILIIETYECLKNRYIFDFISKCLFIYLNIIKPFDYTIIGLVKTQIPIMITGGYLALFFILSHNYQDVKNSNKNTETSFLNNQLLTSSNFKSNILTHLNGGLNYQIEHHLFPRYHHTKYKELSIIVKKYALKKKYIYTEFNSFYDNLKSTILHLINLGKQ
tara:strand:+ start:723 stop:1886 length:1164 start_codon:yes stop_codon:yes gene_type:complete